MAWLGFLVLQVAGALLALWLGGQWWHALLGALISLWLGFFYVSWQNARFYQWAKDEGQAPQRFYGWWANLQYFWRKQQRKHSFREERQQRHLQELRMAIQASPNGVLLLDHDWSIEWLNNTAGEHLGLDIDRDIGQNLLTLVRDPEFASYCAVGDFRETLEMDGRSAVAGASMGRRRLAVQLFEYGEDKRLMLSRDITQIQHTEAMRRDFIANVSHEIRTPLTIFSGYIETLQTLPLQDEERDLYYRRMQQQAQRMQLLVADLLTLSALEGSPLPNLSEYIEVAQLLRLCQEEALALSTSLAQGALAPMHAITLHYVDERGQRWLLDGRSRTAQPVAGDSVEMSQVLADDVQKTSPDGAQPWPANMGRLAGSEKEIQSAFFNLITNAVRYTPAGGAIALVWHWHPDGGASFAVRDTGPGIAAEHLPRLTERFYRVDRSRSRGTGGTGLGLAIVKHVVQRHGGHLHVESQVGKGSQFRIELPAARMVTPVAVVAAEQERARRERMLAA
ncbi:hypothetical protein AAV94_04870 [Lampropedia cohaerens]|uniref:histidine kinase n=1 Tax=Lampropedia cohaerens TaxID=1610491 RepID=A0A0U1Q0Z9_9BURK|nr:ATP-binding protein [Lampropedia cohaerens]KKW68439.1 hypothetical protein AAV94_04870 [Lampropedia cohaerens]